MNLRINFCEHPSWKRPTFNSLVNHNYSKGCFPFLFKRRVKWQINWHTKLFPDKFYENQQTHYRKEFNSREIGLAHQHDRRFIVLEHQYGCHGVMWKRSIGSRHARQIPPPPPLGYIRFLQHWNNTTSIEGLERGAVISAVYQLNS